MHLKNKWGGGVEKFMGLVTGLEQEFENALMFARGSLRGYFR